MSDRMLEHHLHLIFAFQQLARIVGHPTREVRLTEGSGDEHVASDNSAPEGGQR